MPCPIGQPDTIGRCMTPENANADLKPLTSEEFRDVIGHFASGVTVITTGHDGKLLGTTASAFTSLSVEPPMVLVCMNKTSETGKAIHSDGKFGVNILGEGHPDLAIRFAGKGDDKFAGVEYTLGENGEPLLTDALAALECAVVEETTGGTHLVFLAEVTRGATRPGAPLAYFRGQFGRFQGAEDFAALSSLRDRIVARLLPVGEPLDLDELAVSTGIERNTLYHALASLANDGLVDRDAGGAFVVAPITVEAMENALRARGAIEIGVATMRAGDLTADELAGVQLRLNDMEAAEGGPLEIWLESLAAYLDYFVSLSGNPTLVEMHRRANVVGMISSTHLVADKSFVPPAHATAAHRAVLAALNVRDPLGAAQAIERRTEGTIRALRASIEAAGGEI